MSFRHARRRISSFTFFELQVGTDPKVRQKQELKLQDLLVAKQQHELAERERKFAKKYHKVCNSCITFKT